MEDTLKIVMVGEMGVGKTSIINRYIRNIFDPNVENTICVDFFPHNKKFHNRIIRQQIWDTSGEPRFRAITSSYYKSVNAVVLVFDLCNKGTFLKLNRYVADIDMSNRNNLIIICCGNKADGENIEVTKEEINAFCGKKNIHYFEVSSKDGTGVDESFKYILTEYINIVDTVNVQDLRLSTEIIPKKPDGCCSIL